MSTYLAQQLKKLAVPQTTLLLPEKVKPSLLFDPKEAATLERDTVYAIGLTGLEELELLNNDFTVFEATLFNETSKHFERSVQTKEDNEKLDRIIKRFLIMVSPYILLRPAHKALEWLIHRFHIHTFNIDDVVGCVLPFHETKFFVRFLQLLDISSVTSRWNWLEPLQKPGVPLAKSTLLNHCYADLSFMKFVCELVPQAIKVSSNISHPSLKTTLSFYTLTILGAFENCQMISEEMMTLLLPYLLKGLKSDNQDYLCSSYMILSQMVKKTTLAPDFLDKILVKLVERAKPDCLKECTVCLLVIFQYQKPSISKELFTAIIKQKGIIGELESLSESFHCGPFLQPLITKLLSKTIAPVKNEKKGPFRCLLSILKSIRLETKSIRKTVKTLFKKYVIKFDKKDTDKKNISVKDRTIKCFNHLERRYPVVVDEEVKKFMTFAKPKAKSKVRLILYSVGTEKLSNKNKDILFLNICHPTVARRILGVKHLIKSIRLGKIKSADKDIIKETLQLRLNDDEPEIVQTILELEEKLMRYFTVEEIFSYLMNVLKRDDVKWMRVKKNVFQFICNEEELYDNKERENELMRSVFNFMISSNKETPAILNEVILHSKFAKSQAFFTAINQFLESKKMKVPEKDCKDKELKRWNQLLINGITESLKKIDQGTLNKIAYLEVIANDNNTISTFVSLSALTYIVNSSLSSSERINAARKSIKILNQMLPYVMQEEAIKHDTLQGLLLSKLPVSLLSSTLKDIFSLLKANTLDSVEENSQFCDLQADSFYFIANHSNDKNEIRMTLFKKYLEQFLGTLFEEPEKKLRFLSRFWLEHLKFGVDGISFETKWPNIQFISLEIAEEFLSSFTNPEPFFKEDIIITFHLLATLCAPDEKIRSLAIKCVTNILNKIGKVSEPNAFLNLFSYVKEHEEEIISDENQFSFLFSAWLSPALNDPEAQKEGPATRRRTATISITPESVVLREILNLCASNQVEEHCQYGGVLMLKQSNSHELLLGFVNLFNNILDAYHKVGKLPPIPARIINEILSKFTEETASFVVRIDSSLFLALERGLKSTISDLKGEGLPQIVAKVINKKFFAALPNNDVKQKLLTLILSACVNAKNLDDKDKVYKSLHRICFDGKIISKILQLSDHAADVQSVKEARLSRSTASSPYSPEKVLTSDSTMELLNSADWKKITFLLEAIQNKSQILEVELIVPALFDLLKRSLEFESNPRSEYLRQLILSSLLNCCQQLKAKIEENTANSALFLPEKFQVELAVTCIRHSPNPQTQNLALILLNLAAVMYPNHVLHNIMAIFTFMGTNMVRQDDSYSFQVISKTIETVIPALMRASQLQTEEIASAVVQVFADAFYDIPRHRRLPLFSKLISVLEPNKYLWLPLIHLIASRSQTNTKIDLRKNEEDKAKNVLPEAVEFAIELSLTQNPAVQIAAANKLVQRISALTTDTFTKKKQIKASQESKTNENEDFLFGNKQLTEKDVKYLKYMGIFFIASLISSEQFISQIVDLNEQQVSKMEAYYTQFLESTLKYLQQVAHLTQENSQNTSFRFWKSLQHKIYDLIEKINALLPSNQFVFVIQGLMHHKLPVVCRKAMEMLNAKLLHQSNFFGEGDIPLLLDLIKPLTKIAKGTSKQGALEKEEIIVNQQTALIGLKLLSKTIGTSHPSAFKKTIEVVIKIVSKENNPPQLKSSGFLCLAELCNSLRAHTLPYLNQFVPLIIDILEDKEALANNELLLLSLVTTIHRVVENLSPFLSPYLHSLVKNVCLLSDSETSGQKSSMVQIRLKIVRGHLATDVPCRIILPIVKACYEELSSVGSQQMAIGPLLSILSNSVSRLEKKELSSNLPELQNFYLTALDFRKCQPKNLLSRVNAVEDHVIESMISLVLKLSETSFRPIFYQVFEWATVEEDYMRERILTFYRLTSSLAEKLKSLFVLFASHFVTNAAMILQANNVATTEKPFFGSGKKATDKACQLLQYILSTLHLCFLHDNKYLVDKDCFNTLMQPLVDQVENTLGEESQYEERISKYVSPCLAQFAAATSDDSCWKSFNYQLLLKTRNSSPKVRFAALSVLQEVVEKLGEDYMSLLPESIPFLAELMEDESFEVEEQCQAVVSKMENILGEPLMKYF